VELCRELLEEALSRRPGCVAGRRNSAGPSYSPSLFPTELLFEALLLGRGNNWSEECTEKVLDLVVELIEFENENGLCSMEQSFERFRHLILLHSCERPPWSVGLYDKEQLKQLTEFIVAHHYKHFNLHKYMGAEVINRLVLEQEDQQQGEKV